MSQSLASDERGVIQPCPACGTSNRISYSRLNQQGRCGDCKSVLAKIGLPLEITDITAFANLMSQSPLPIVIDFWAAWCGPCRMMAPEFAKAANEAQGEVLFAKVNSDEQPDIAARFRIQGIPAFVLLRDGKMVAQTSGFQPASRLLSWIRQASSA